MTDRNELAPIEEDQKAGSALDQAGQAWFRLGRIFSRHPLKDQLQRHTGQAIELSRILVTEAVATGSAEPDQEVTVGVVAERLGIDPSTASRLVAETIGAGYLARLPSQMDNRRLRLELTDAGRKLVANALHAWSSSRSSFLKDITSIKDQRCSKDDRSDRSPSLASVSGASDLLQHVVCWVLDGNSKSCRCSQSSTCPCQEPGATEQHGDQLHRWSLKTRAGPRLLALPVAGGR